MQPSFLLEKVKKEILALTSSDIYKNKYLLTVSGGRDSMVLLDIFYRLGLDISVAHVNFRLRGKDSDADQNLVEERCQALNVPFHKRSFDTKSLKTDSKLSLQELARNLRYQWFEDLCQEIGVNYIVTAHHQQDNIETAMMVLVKGGGIESWKGIPVANKNIIRPLLKLFSSEIDAYARMHKIQFREDESNKSTAYLRNNIRLTILPKLREINPSFDKQMQLHFQLFNELNALTTHVADELKRKYWKEVDHKINIDYKIFDDASGFVEVILFNWLLPFGFNPDTIRSIARNSRRTGKVLTSENYTLLFDRTFMSLYSSRDKAYKNDQLIIDGFGDYELPDGTIFSIHAYDDTQHQVQNNAQCAFYLPDTIFPLMLRHRLDGDRFFPKGMQGKQKTLKKYFIDEKISLADKDSIWLLTHKDEIVWVVGKRSDDRFHGSMLPNVYCSWIVE
ncbi:MAG: tRNA lysidine(34) synthetase TilS [Saprospiraceae bacterium]|nr:tRNA lysidine(34) synthetase TilS [Saprospiraceae bacterium]